MGEQSLARFSSTEPLGFLLNMASLSITIPDNRLVESLEAMCFLWGYQSTVNGVANPETKQQFCRRKLAELVKSLVIQGSKDKAAYTAGEAAKSAIKDIAIT